MPYSPRLPALLFITIATLRAPAAGAGAAPATRPIDVEDAKSVRAVRDLGSDDFAVRERATKQLWAAGARAGPALKEAAAGDDPEAALRARTVLRKIRLGVRPDAPPDVLEALLELDAADPEGKARRVRRMYEDPRLRSALASLWPRVSQEKAWRAALKELASLGAAEAAGVLAEEPAAAEVPLETAMAGGGEKAGRDYAAYLLVTGGLPRATARWQAESAAGVKAADRVLVYLHRAAGDLGSAAAAAGRLGDAALRRQMLLEAGNHEAATRPGPAAAEDGAAGAVRRGRVDEAVRKLVSAGDTPAAAELLFARLHITEALAVLEQPAPAAQGKAGVLKADLLYQVGRREEAARAWDLTFRAALAAGAWDVCGGVIRAERAAGGQEAAAASHALALMNRLPAEDTGQTAFARFSDEPQAERAWFDALRRVYPHEEPAETLRRHWALSARRLPPDQAGALASKVATATVNGTPGADRLWWLEQLGHLLRDAGDYSGADRHYSQMLYGHNSPRGMLHRADLALRRRQWARAADLFARAHQMDPAAHHAAYLRGVALAEAGRKDEARKVLRAASARPLSDERRRADLAKALESQGLPEHAAEQRSILLKTGAPDSPHVIAALGPEAARAEAAAQFARAAALHERFIHSEEASASPAAALKAVAASHRLRARAALHAGDAEAALGEVDACLDLLPGDVDSAVRLVGDLERAGRKGDADGVFRRVAEALNSAAEAHSGAEFLRRDVERLRKECRRG